MRRQDTQDTAESRGDQPSAPEIAAALADCARLALRAMSGTPAEGSSVFTALLERLLGMCAAPQGALLLVAAPDGPDAPDAPGGAAEHRLARLSAGLDMRILAVHGVTEDEMLPLLAAGLPDGTGAGSDAGIQPDETLWIVHPLPVGEYLARGQRSLSGTSSPTSSPTNPTTHLAHAALLLGWPGGQPGYTAIARAHAALAQLEDAVAAVIASALLADYAREQDVQGSLRQIMSQAAALREADHLRAELLGTVSHELRSPLAAIKGYAATLLRHERRLPREERHEFLLAIDEATDRLAVIIDRLLQMSELETGTLPTQRAPVDVARIGREALAAIEGRTSGEAPGRFAFSLRLASVDGTPAERVPLVTADPRLLRIVLDNLLENAVKYSPEGGHIALVVGPASQNELPSGAEPALPVGRTERTGRMLGIQVQDQGVGIPSEHLGRIFDRFHRVDTRLTREVDGLGLGLAICQRIVELHGGAIWAESAPGAGSTVHVLLPLETADATETKTPNDPPMPGVQSMPGVPPAPGAPVAEET